MSSVEEISNRRLLLQGGHKVGEKNPRVLQSHNYIFPEVIATKLYEARMWAYAQRDGRPRNIGGALCCK